MGFAERKPAIVQDRDARRRQPRNAVGNELPNTVDGLTAELGAGFESQPHRRARRRRGFVGEGRAATGRDNHLRVVDARDAAQRRREVAGETVARLSVEHGLRRQRIDARERFARTRAMHVRDAREREPEQQLVAAASIDSEVVGDGDKRNVPFG